MKENKQGKEAVYSQRVKAGRRTYFFDIKSNRVNDFYLTITESKKRNPEDTFYEKQKLFLYKEDILSFTKALEETLHYLKTELLPDYDFNKVHSYHNGAENNGALDNVSENIDSDELKWE